MSTRLRNEYDRYDLKEALESPSDISLSKDEILDLELTQDLDSVHETNYSLARWGFTIDRAFPMRQLARVVVGDVWRLLDKVKAIDGTVNYRYDQWCMEPWERGSGLMLAQAPLRMDDKRTEEQKVQDKEVEDYQKEKEAGQRSKTEKQRIVDLKSSNTNNNKKKIKKNKKQMESLEPDQGNLPLKVQSQERERKIKHLPKIKQSKQMERGSRNGSSPEGSLQKLSTLNSSFLHEILNKMELLNDNMITSNKNTNPVLQQIYKICSQSDTDGKNAREELSRLNEYISIMNSNLNEATHKNACNLLKNLSDQMSQMHTDIAQIKRSASMKPSDTPLRESMVKEEEPSLNQTLKILPPITDWPKIAAMRLPRLFEGVALDWFVTKSKLDNPHDWEAWKAMEEEDDQSFESDFFDPIKDKPHKWCLQQKKRIDMDQDLPHLIAVMEEVIEMKGLNKKFLKETSSVKRPVESKDIKTEEPTPIKRTPIPENLTALTLKKKNNIMDLLAESEAEDTGSQFDLIISDPMEERETHAIVVIQADIGDEVNINTIQGEAHLPQKWDYFMKIGHVSDAKMLLNKPDTGMSYTMGQTCYTTAHQDDTTYKVFLDIGTFCSCTSVSYLDKTLPDWKKLLLPLPKGKFTSCTTRIEAIGIVPLKLIFPHTRGSVRMTIEFVVMKEAICHYLIIGNDAFTLYGIDVFQSKGRYFTIGGDWKKKFQINNINAVLPDVGQTEKEKFDQEYFSQASISDKLTYLKKGLQKR
ncbi:hypothetical protein PPACK8108_LOCUS5485 [Phakopsora pachyrhizi]|uniref:Uncharacterized protein n=1 Tax=Phakopsora pachyrhizi TaxID=170000 RepID=A0AAV0AT04_PHAPC|nr:hypothetical protein PPACK8108_LOCUS5485 [Phakopsora pachyrhizi]